MIRTGFLILASLSCSSGAVLFSAALSPDQVVPKVDACDPLVDIDCRPVPSPVGIFDGICSGAAFARSEQWCAVPGV
ncbi:MAG: hypothetical protein ACI9R3_000205 [Verrucomicrobiales bacterium]|jgi:hypothetical protein